MPPLRIIALFFLKVAVFYGIFLIPWPGIMPAYRSAFRVCGNSVFRNFGTSGRVLFEPGDKSNDELDTRIGLENTKAGVSGKTAVSARQLGYLPTCFALALTLATPIPWLRHTKAAFWVIVLMSGFAALRLTLILTAVYSEGNALSQFSFGPWQQRFFEAAHGVISRSPVTAYIASSVAWGLVVFRRQDFRRWSGGAAAERVRKS